MAKKFTLKELILITLLAVISIVSKPFVFYFSSLFTSTFNLPAGIIGGVYYMMWLTLIYRIINKPFSVILFCVLQGFLAVLINGIFLIKAITFVFPGVGAEIVLYTFKNRNDCLVNVMAGAVANFTGSVLSYVMFIGKQFEPLVIVIFTSLISGGLSGLLTTFIFAKITRLELIKKSLSYNQRLKN
ncbi:ECF transporter S component [Thermohalobacter berrensis]|uniref:Uncharacterized protein n=1 Tax=Thermohalobacter berrensis TaxID=99594 RepID=A0A419SWF4_9FIRM|nr:ECF transporter S component [Thermohalobacter berrensis]RKD29567.1 hypothetical protein BET03_05775 [Thermohalobacter berrensis]